LLAAAARNELFGCQRLVKPQDERPIANATRKANSIRRVRGYEYSMARRTDHVPAGTVMLRKNATNWQHHGIQTLPLDIAARVGHGSRGEPSNL